MTSRLRHAIGFLYFYILYHLFSFSNLFFLSLPHPLSVSTFKSAFLSFFFIHCFWHFCYKSIHFFVFPYFLLFHHLTMFQFIFLFTVLLYSIVSVAFTPYINGSTEFLTYHPKLFLFYPYASLTTYQSPSSHFPTKIYPINITFGM